MNRRDFIHAAAASGVLALQGGVPTRLSGAQKTHLGGQLGLSPDAWSPEKREYYLGLEQVFNGPHPEAVGSAGMVAGTSNPFAIHAGRVALERSGTAADAALCTALTQVSLMFGAATSYAGVLNALYYHAATAKTYTIDACYKTVQNETDPMSIPPLGTPSGRAVLVPGFMAGVEALSTRFGRLPFAKLFEPAIWIAHHGTPANAFLVKPFAAQRQLVTRLPEGKQIFLKPDGGLYQAGDLFRQPLLAETLENIAQRGADYMYRGEWARRFVAAVQREGGKLTLDDLSAYRPIWAEPLEISYGPYRLNSLGAPNLGGTITLVAMNLLAAAKLKRFGHYTQSAEALFWSIQISRLATLLANRPPESLQGYFPRR